MNKQTRKLARKQAEQRGRRAETLAAWEQRFQNNRQQIAGLLDERFCRMWEFYLIISEMSFRHGKHMVFQIQLSKSVDNLPITRDYMAAAEASM